MICSNRRRHADYTEEADTKTYKQAQPYSTEYRRGHHQRVPLSTIKRWHLILKYHCITTKLLVINN